HRSGSTKFVSASVDRRISRAPLRDKSETPRRGDSTVSRNRSAPLCSIPHASTRDKTDVSRDASPQCHCRSYRDVRSYDLELVPVTVVNSPEVGVDPDIGLTSVYRFAIAWFCTRTTTVTDTTSIPPST